MWFWAVLTLNSWMNKAILKALITSIVLCACNNGGQTSSDETSNGSIDSANAKADTLHLFEEEEPPVSADELFVDFFFNFASDVKYQSQRIKFPLTLKDKYACVKLSKDDWQQFNRFKAQEFYSVIYERENDLELQNDTSVSKVSVQWIDLKEEYIEEFNFNRINGKWMLTDMEKNDMKSSPNGSFLHFYAQFVADSTFQRESIVTPLKFITPSEDPDEDTMVEELSVDDWFEMQADMPVITDVIANIDYGQTCISQNRKKILMEGVSNGLCIKFKFDKIGTQWRLFEVEN